MIELFPRQQEAIKILSRHSDVEQLLYGGAAGGAKSFLGCYWQISRRLKYPGTRGLIGRAKLDTLKKTTLNTFFEVCKLIGERPLRAGIEYDYNQQSNIIKFYNGSEIVLKDLFYYPSDPDFDSLGSLEITDYFIDEASQVTQKAVNVVSSRVRYKLREFDLKPKGLLTCNPSKGWLYSEFYDRHMKGKLPNDLAFLPALPHDNPHLPESYYQTLSRLPENLRKRLRDGDWNYDDSKDALFKFEDCARMFELPMQEGKGFISADVAAMGDDMTIIGVWKGLSLTHIYEIKHKYPHEVAAAIREIATRHGVTMNNTVVDSDGLGIGVQGILKCKQFLNGAAAKDPKRFKNMRSQCYYILAEHVEHSRITAHVPAHKDEITRQLDAVRRKDMDKDGKFAVVPREEIVQQLGYSPDIASMMMMRMYFELNPSAGAYSFGSFG